MEERELAVRRSFLDASSEAVVLESEGTTVDAVAFVEESDGAQRSADALGVLILSYVALRLGSAGVGGRVVGEAGLATEAFYSRVRARSAGGLAGLADFFKGEEASRAVGDTGILEEGARVTDALTVRGRRAGRTDQLAGPVGEGEGGVEAG